MLHRIRIPLAFTAAATIALLIACEGSAGPTEISRDDVLGVFSAETFESTTAGTTTDHLAAGAVLMITLNEDGTTTGQLSVPGGDEDGSDFDASLAGTFSFDDGTDEVTFDHDADTFVRDVTFVAVRTGGGVELEAEGAFGATTFRVVLSS